MKIRNALPSDHSRIISVMKDWWGGRDLRKALPKLFLTHFCNTSFLVEKEDELVAFLVGFFSQSMPTHAYIHFAGVHPEFQKTGIGTTLYHKFFQKCLENDRTIVQSCTSPVNKGSIAFHQKMGFEIVEGNGDIQGIPVFLDYNYPGDTKVLFKNNIELFYEKNCMEIRQATINDVKLLSGIVRKSYLDVASRFELSKGNCPKHPSNCQDEWIEHDFVRGVVYYILFNNGLPIGCAALEQADSDICYLERLCVLPQHRQHGYGKELVSYIFKKAAALNARIMSIGIIADQIELKVWYERFGFVEEQTKTFPHLPFKVTIMKAIVNELIC